MQPNLLELIHWAVSEAATIERVAPFQIHAKSGDRDDWGVSREGIRGLPFSRPFEKHIDRVLPSVALVRSLRKMDRQTKLQKLQYRIAKAIVDGSVESLDGLSRLGTPFTVRSAALGALLALHAGWTYELKTG